MKKTILFLALFSLILGFNLTSLATVVVSSRPPTIGASASTSSETVTFSVNGELGQQTQGNECFDSGSDPAIYQYAVDVKTQTIPSNAVTITAGPSALLNQTIPITITPGTDGDCFTAASRSTFSGSRSFSLAPGTYTVTITVNDGGSASRNLTFTVPAADPLNVSCSGSPAEPAIDTNVLWTGNISGGNGTYTKSWSGTAITSASNTTNPGNVSSFTKSYLTEGTKTANLSVTSGTQTQTATCSISVVPPPDQPPVTGYHDGFSGNVSTSLCSAYGWATVSGNNTDLSVRILSDGAVVDTVTASQFRSGLESVCSGGTCEFASNLSTKISAGVNHTIRAEARHPVTGVWTLLGTSPKTLNCAAVPVAPTVTLTANPSSIPYNTASTLTWSSTDTTSCTASANPSSSVWTGAKATGGNQSTGNLTTTTTYSITCTGAGGSATATRTVTVELPVTVGVNSNLATKWTLTGPSSVDNQTTNSVLQNYSPRAAGTYTITADSKPGYKLSISPSSASRTISAGSSFTFYLYYDPLPTVDLVATPTSVPYNGSANLTWTSTNASSCTGTNFSTGNATNNTTGVSTGALTATRTYSISCTGAGGEVQDSVTVNVGAVPAPTVTLSASPNPVAYNTASTLTWSSTNATSCTASGEWSGTKAVLNTSPGESTGNLTSSKTYTLTCTGAGGTSAPASVTVNVNPQAPTTGTITINSNLATTWSLSGPTPQTQSTNVTSRTYSTQDPGIYTLTPTAQAGYTFTIAPTASQSLTAGSSLTYTITYTASGGGGALDCVPANQTVNTGQQANFSASGGSGAFSWSTNPAGSPSTGGNLSTFNSTWSAAGSKVVTVTRGASSDTCNVNVIVPTPDYSLSASPQTVYMKSGETTGIGPTISIAPFNGFNSPVYLCALNSQNPSVFTPPLPHTRYVNPKPINYPYTGGVSTNYVFPNPLQPNTHAVTMYASATSAPECNVNVRSVNFTLIINETGLPPGPKIPPFEEF